MWHHLLGARDDLVQLIAVSHFKPGLGSALKHAAVVLIEVPYLIATGDWQLRRDPVHRFDDPLPFWSIALAIIVHITGTDNVDQSVIQHACRTVHKHKDALSTEKHTRQVLPLSVSDKLSDA